MDKRWKSGSPQDLLRDLRPGGRVYGESPQLPRLITLHKTDIRNDLRKMTEYKALLWRIGGDPNATGHYAKDRRRVIIWLGGDVT